MESCPRQNAATMHHKFVRSGPVPDNLKVSIMSGVGCVLAFESAIFGQFQASATGDFAALSTQHPVRSAKLSSVGTG